MPSVRHADPHIHDVDTSLAVRLTMWLSLAVCVFWVVMSLTYPFGWDQGLLAWAGDVIVRGGMPYRDAWDIKGPLAHYTYAFAQVAFGVHLWSIRIVDAALLVAAAFSVLRAATALTDWTAGRWAAVFFFLWYASHSYWHTAQPDGWAGMLLIIGFEPLLTRRRSRAVVQMATVGVFVGMATLLKPLYVLFVLLMLAHIAMTHTRRWVALSTGLVAGWLLPIVMMAGWFGMHGALDELIAVHLRYSALYVALSPGNRLRGLAEYLFETRVVSVALPIIVYGGIVLWRTRRSEALLLIAWVALVLFSVTLQNRFYDYQWVPILPAATLLATVGLYEVQMNMRTLGQVLGGVLLLQCVAPIALEASRFVLWASGRIDRQAYYDAYGEPGDDMRAVSWLRQEGHPGAMYVFGWHATIPWLSQRQTVSRFGFSLPLMMGDGLDIRSQYRAELLDALRATPPRYIVVGTQSEEIIGTKMTIADFPELADLVARAYREVARLGTIAIYERES